MNMRKVIDRPSSMAGLKYSAALWSAIALFLMLAACSEPTARPSDAPPETTTQPIGPARDSLVATRIRPKDEAVMVYVPAGKFPMGSGEVELAAARADCPGCPTDWFDGELPQHNVSLAAYWFDKYEISNAQFARFIQDNGYEQRPLWTAEGWEWLKRENRRQPKYWDDARWNQAQQPVVGVVWFEALAYCRWAGARLPTEAEWERAAGYDAQRGAKYVYPWGNTWDARLANTAESSLGITTPVGSYCPQAASPVGVCDLAGNAWEWVSSQYMPYPYRADDGREDPEAHGTRALRGGSWINERDRARVSYRLPPFPGDFILFDPTNGFRCAMSDH